MTPTTTNTATTSAGPVISPALARKLIQLRYPNQRMSSGACVAISELLRLFILEARHRASIEAECEVEGGIILNDTNMDSDNNLSPQQVSIRPDHIAKIAAELLMDFS